jgi:hypothetical protein
VSHSAYKVVAEFHLPKPSHEDHVRSYSKISVKSLRSLGFDERWLQQRIVEDPSILGLGDVVVVERERQMVGGGRLDLLLADVESGTRYEVELMLGALDESHIIRTIEYWDIERRRYPNLNHYAVIVAEDITSRFLNVISLLNKSVPLMALQMSALDLEEKVGLTFVKVLDLTETFDELDGDEEPRNQVTRAEWEKDGYRDSLKVVDLIAESLKAKESRPKSLIQTSTLASEVLARTSRGVTQERTAAFAA